MHDPLTTDQVRREMPRAMSTMVEALAEDGPLSRSDLLDRVDRELSATASISALFELRDQRRVALDGKRRYVLTDDERERAGRSG